jgi:hypothetical protein
VSKKHIYTAVEKRKKNRNMTDHRETPNTYISRIGGGKYLDPKADLTEAPTELLDNELTSKALGIVEKSAMSEA